MADDIDNAMAARSIGGGRGAGTKARCFEIVGISDPAGAMKSDVRIEAKFNLPIEGYTL